MFECLLQLNQNIEHQLGSGLVQRLPDLPRWVEARAWLLWGRCEIFGLREEPELSLVIRDPATEGVVVIGTPEVNAIRVAVARNARCVIAPWGKLAWLAEALPDWIGTRAILHELRNPRLLPVAEPGRVGWIDPARLDDLSIPEELLGELRIGALQSPIAATFVDRRPIAFCYAGAVTETLWDVAIDTLAEHRRRGYAGLCAAHLIRHLQAQGKQPVWGAVEDNPASWKLARKIGFEPVDELALFEPQPAPSRSRISQWS